MSKTAFIFPGQGAQYVGMGKDFYEQYPVAKEVFELASKVTGIDVAKLCFEENEDINITEYTQLAMLTTEVAILKVAEQKGLKADCAAGLSLGEYGALAASEVMELADLFALIRKRGIYMQEAYPVGGAMTAVLGMDATVIEKICEETDGIVSIANYNCPGQIVITGEQAAVERAMEALKEAGARKCIPLKVSGPFHSALLEQAGEKLTAELAGITVKDPVIPYACNVEATMVTKADRVKELLSKQVCASVRWQQCIETMRAEGVDTFIEIGPGKTLTGFNRKIDKEIKTYNIETVEDLEKIMEVTTC
ncbi:MAG: ACP S-malonyltransferase [Lachnospiraceae bacterium]|nr:ACP S-malonyltransferase [Lachnospiraceae bacterium]